VECLHGKLWLTIRHADQKEFVDDKYLVPGERYSATHALVVWISSLNDERAEFKVNAAATKLPERPSWFSRENLPAK
jgi:hypothetical protein